MDELREMRRYQQKAPSQRLALSVDPTEDARRVSREVKRTVLVKIDAVDAREA